MNPKLILVLCLHITTIYSAPMKLQMMPMPYGLQSQNPFLQLQNPFFRQGIPNLQSPFMPQQQPMMLLLPNAVPSTEAEDRFMNLNEENLTSSLKSDTENVDESKEAIVLDAETNTEDIDAKKPVVLMPNGGRNGIGQIISYIPFLPIEINVADAFGWITGLLPGNLFGRPAAQSQNTKRYSYKEPMPILMVPVPMMSQV